MTPPPETHRRPSHMSSHLHDYGGWLRTHNYSLFTVEDRITTIAAFINWASRTHHITEAQDVTFDVVEQYQAHLYLRRKADGRPLSLGTQLARLVRVKAFFRWLAARRTIPFDPTADLQLPRNGKGLPAAVLTPDEVELVIAQPNLRTIQGLRDRAILETLYATAIRRLELIRLRVTDVDRARGVLSVRKGKGLKDRWAPLGSRAIAWMDAYLDHARPRLMKQANCTALFLTARGAPLSPRKLTDRVARYVAVANLGKSGSCHLFRHATATSMLDGGADIRHIQTLLGHENLATTQIYTQVSVAKLVEVHALTHPGLRDGLRDALPNPDELLSVSKKWL